MPDPSVRTVQSGLARSRRFCENRLVDVTSDYLFKEIFDNIEITQGFLEAILIGDGKLFPTGAELSNLEFMASEQVQKGKVQVGRIAGKNTKRMIIDIKLKTSKSTFIIEMQRQVADNEIFLRRVQFYASVAHSNQTIKGVQVRTAGQTCESDYLCALPVIAIVLVGVAATLFPDCPPISYHRILETTTHQNYLDSFSLVFFELSKFTDSGESKLSERFAVDPRVKEWACLMRKTDFSQHTVFLDKSVQAAADVALRVVQNSYQEYYLADYIQELAEWEDLNALAKKCKDMQEKIQEKDQEIADLRAAMALAQAKGALQSSQDSEERTAKKQKNNN